ncbi:flagellar hook-basal body protein [Pseudodesulfovibrio thermohalotolerans]|uniref:flagellar hook-basal body protein n=1 Tax=Pseudodesulfovibrio thermohalotolerans TaxID=2880651 RepID=UPI00244344DA|nr:flagellar hook-basal body protein [Pseudodesulfovibrio thermohalotolerans]WFS63789.1 flagellar hook-basal body protein [Pseudodesulfovibrio thermohalotolerans]
MRDSTQSAIFGALSNELRMSSIANNLANVNTSAFKKDKLAFHDTFVRFAHDYLVDSKTSIRGKDMFPEGHIMAKARLSAQQPDFQQGSLERTGNQLDFALSGQGFFSVQGDDGMLYTRAGNFVTDSNGMLRTLDGHPVLVSGGPLIVPPGGRIEADGDGNVLVNGQPAGAFDLVDFEDPTALERAGSNYFVDPGGAGQIPPEELAVAQGFIEKSNVEVVTEMVSMIETQRAFTMYTKMIQTDSDLDTKLITQVGRPTA